MKACRRTRRRVVATAIYWQRAGSASKIDLAPCDARAGEVKLRANQRRAAQGGENPTLFPQLSDDRAVDRRADEGCIRAVLGETARERADQVAVRFKAEHFEARQAMLA
jgi:hypothetical protein